MTTGTRIVYLHRLEKERAITEEEIAARMKWSLPVLSENQKCSVALDLPVTNCVPTAVCAAVCYASQGRQYYRKSVIKALAVNRLIAEDPEHVARKMVDEAEGRYIRLAGSGELSPEHNTLVDYLEQFGGKWWGFTRRVDTHQAIPKLMFSIDRATPDQVLQYVREHVAPEHRAYLRGPRDPPPSLEVAVTFPVHGPLTNYVADVPLHETDCPATREGVKCWTCQRCYPQTNPVHSS